MHARIKLFGLGENSGVIRTIARSTTLDASELRKALPMEQLQKLFPKGTGLKFDFVGKQEVMLHPENGLVAHVNDQPLSRDEPHQLLLGDEKIVSINGQPFRLQVVGSYFACQ